MYFALIFITCNVRLSAKDPACVCWGVPFWENGIITPSLQMNRTVVVAHIQKAQWYSSDVKQTAKSANNKDPHIKFFTECYGNSNPQVFCIYLGAIRIWLEVTGRLGGVQHTFSGNFYQKATAMNAKTPSKSLNNILLMSFYKILVILWLFQDAHKEPPSIGVTGSFVPYLGNGCFVTQKLSVMRFLF